MARVNVDTSELRALAADMRAVPERLNRHLRPVIERGALNVKNALQEDMSARTHFPQLARSINYDVHLTSFDGDGVMEAEIGPDKARFGGALANIAYFGASRGGGGRVRDPMERLEEEQPRFEQALADALEDLL